MCEHELTPRSQRNTRQIGSGINFQKEVKGRGVQVEDLEVRLMYLQAERLNAVRELY